MQISANSPIGGSETLDATSLDNPANLDFYDPVLDGEIEEPKEEGIESEAEAETVAEDETEVVEEVDAQSSQDEDETDVSEEPEDGQPEDAEDDPKPEVFTLPTGEEVTRDELMAGYTKEADYRRKSMAVAENRKAVEELAQRTQRQVEALTNFLAGALPAEPQPNLAYTDPQTYNAQKAAYDQQMGSLQKLLAMAEEPKRVQEEITQQISKEELEEESNRLAAAFPMTANPKGREAFFKSVFEAANQLGFTDAEMQSTKDSRLLGLAYYAKIGMQAEKAKAKAKQKVAQAPKAPPKRQRTSARSDQAMSRLQKSGSIHDAVLVDFE